MIGMSTGGEGLRCLTLNSPDCTQHKTPSVSMKERERDRERANDGGERRGKEGATGEKLGFMMSRQICVLTR